MLVINFNSLFLHKSPYTLIICFSIFLILYLLLYTLIVVESTEDIFKISFVAEIKVVVLDLISLALSYISS